MKFLIPSLLCAAFSLNISGYVVAAPTLEAPEKIWAADPKVLMPSDLRLDRPVAIEVRRVALPEFVRQLSEKSGVGLQCSDALATRKVSAHIESMSLRDVLRALSRLYGLEWSATPQGLIARLFTNELETKWLQLGDLNETQARHMDRQSAKKLTAQVLKETDAAQLHTPEGIALSTQPQLAKTLRDDRETLSAFRLIVPWGNIMPWTLRNSFLRVENTRLQTPDSVKSMPKIVLFDAQGSPIVVVGQIIEPEKVER